MRLWETMEGLEKDFPRDPQNQINTPRDPAFFKGAPVPAVILDLREDGAQHLIDFFVASIRNPHTRAAYFRTTSLFLT